MSTQEPLVFGRYYHVFNRGNNSELIFRREENYRYFLRRYASFIAPVALTFAYCLMPNHFHFLIRIMTKSEQEQYYQSTQPTEPWQLLDPTLQFRRFFISYSKAFNKEHGRTGSLFQKNFRRKSVNSRHYFLTLMAYIHQNPQKHRFVADFREWQWSSYRAMLSDKETSLERATVLDWYDNRTKFSAEHDLLIDETVVEPIWAGDWFS